MISYESLFFFWFLILGQSNTFLLNANKKAILFFFSAKKNEKDMGYPLSERVE